jgi:hypothetical protein
MSEELSSQVPFYSTKGDLPDIEDQDEVSSEFLFYNVSKSKTIQDQQPVYRLFTKSNSFTQLSYHDYLRSNFIGD